MYFLVENTGALKIVRNFEKIGHKMPTLINYLTKNNITYLDNKDKATGSGLYCLPVGINKFRVIRVEQTDDGYIWRGSRVEEHHNDIEVVYYQMNDSKMMNVCREMDL